jgi:hypothetical protein
MALTPGVGRFWYPLLKAVIGAGLIMDGFFSQDPVAGYPVGSVVGATTTHAVVHPLAAFVTITASAVSCFVLARRFVAEPRWRSWVIYTILTGVLTSALIAAFGAADTVVGAPAGHFERLASWSLRAARPGVNTLLSLLIFARLLLNRRASAHR